MTFRYKVCRHKYYRSYLIKIQEYKTDAHIFHWKNFDCICLQYMLKHLNQSALSLGNEMSNYDIYCELKKYDNMNDLVIRYIKKHLLDLKNLEEVNAKIIFEQIEQERYIEKFTLTNGWTSLEIKEKETQNED